MPEEIAYMHQGRIAYVDTLRGIASMGVIIYHLRLIASGGPLRTPSAMAAVTDRVFEAGVPLFFAISGFLLTMLMPTYERHRYPVATFYLKRYFRIAPLFYITIAIWTAWSNVMPPTGTLIANITFTFNFIPGMENSLVFAGWTIGVEMLFYFIFPVFNSVISNMMHKVTALLGSLVIANICDFIIVEAGLPPIATLTSFFHSLPLFVIGMLAYDISVRLRQHSQSREIAILLLAASALVFDLLVTNSTVLFNDRYWQGVGCGLGILSFAVHPLFLVNRATAFVGRISYSMYLLHGFIITLMGRVFLAPYKWGLPPFLAFPADALMALIVIIPISWVFFETVESPGNWLGSVLVRALNRWSLLPEILFRNR